MIALLLIAACAYIHWPKAQIKPYFSMKKACFLLFLGTLTAGALAQPVAQAPTAPASAAAGQPTVLRWVCNAFYLPARSIWQRRISVESDATDVLAIQIDGVPVYTFNAQGTTLMTAVDSERIQFDIAAQTWTSDMRGIVSSQGRCDRTE